uniref:Dynamin-type G domain-containing protein n=1 Tax=Setaria digitata TaxID=48799 RepID=A0A915PN07_9BILA
MSWKHCKTKALRHPHPVITREPEQQAGSRITIASRNSPDWLGMSYRRSNGEPLKRFTEAKASIGDIYNELESYITDLSLFYNEILSDSGSIPDEQMQEVARFKDSIKTIRDMFMRDTMKVVFFGRTSNGKSSVINAMLHAKVLPQGMGHTTCCFLQVEGSPDDEKFVLNEDSSERIDIEQLQRLGHAMSDSNVSLTAMGQDSLLRVFYPKSASRLLQNDVVIVDRTIKMIMKFFSPGVDLSPEFDSWIDKHCMDADVFVLVCNAESTLTQAEKSFFHRVSAKLSRPNIFILNNRWDASAAEVENMQQIREQHMTRFKQFLVNELRVCSESEAANRIFFISAREMLDVRLKEQGLIRHAYQVEGHQYRSMEFCNFEAQFERLISKSAISTKFEAHERRAREIVGAMRNNLDVVQSSTLSRKVELQADYVGKEAVFKECLNNWKEFERFAVVESQRLRNEVHLKVSADFYEEMQKLESIIDRFDEKFIDEPVSIRDYKKNLADFVDKVVTEDLEARCTRGLMQRIWNLENAIFYVFDMEHDSQTTDKFVGAIQLEVKVSVLEGIFLSYFISVHVNQILAEPYTKKLEQVWRYRPPFNFSICINCPSLMEDFREDLEFRFSFGVTAIIRRINAYRLGKPVTAVGSQPLLDVFKNYKKQTNIEVGEGPALQNCQEDMQIIGAADSHENAVMAQFLLSSIGYVANGGLGLLIIGGIVSKTVSWRFIAAGVGLYGGLYALEYWRWNSGAKEQHLKDQFRHHLSARMRNVAATHTSHCETQVLREMQQVLGGLKSTVGGVHQEMKTELDNIRKEIGKIDHVTKGLNTIKGKTSFLNTDLDRFENEFLKSGSNSPVIQQ